MMLVPAGPPVDSVIGDLLPHLEKGDLIIDAGNSYFKDTNLRARNLTEHGIQFLGVGVSGGEEGARHGPSIMPGGPKEAYERVRLLFEAISARVNGDACVDYLGPDRASGEMRPLPRSTTGPAIGAAPRRRPAAPRGQRADVGRGAGGGGAERPRLRAGELRGVSAERVAEPLPDRRRDGRRPGAPRGAVARPRRRARARLRRRGRHAAGRRGGDARRRARPARTARALSGLRGSAAEEGSALREDLRASRLVRGRRPRELGGRADNG